jgi:hypothetical protein
MIRFSGWCKRFVVAVALGLPWLVPATRAHADGEIEQRLVQPVSLKKSINRNTPLKELLEFLSDRYDLTILIDTKAFKDLDKDSEIEDAPVYLPKLSKVPLRTVLKVLLKQVNGTYAIKKGYVEVVPAPRQRDQERPAVKDSKEEKELRTKLAKPTTLEEGIKANTPFKEVLEFLSARYELNIVMDIWAFGQWAKIADLEDAPVKLQQVKNITLEEILRLVLKQVHSTYRLEDNVILIIPEEKKDK